MFAGGLSYGCSGNSGAAGTFYDTRPRKLTVSNHNMSTETDTLLMEFPYQPLLTNVYIENCARAAAPLLWSRMQVTRWVTSSSLRIYACKDTVVGAARLLLEMYTINMSCTLLISHDTLC